jgi:hypothetical protein
LKEELDNNSIYELKISKNINKYLKADIIKRYNTSKKLIVKDFKFLNYSKTCLYLSNQIENYWDISDKIFITNPKSREVELSDYDY